MTGAISSLLAEKKETILKLWEERSIQEVSSAKAGATLALRDSVPLYLDHLSDALSTNRRMDFRSVFAHEKEGNRIGKLHGADRASNRSYLLTEVIFEYHILREVIFQVLETETTVDGIYRDIILDSIEQAVNDAAVEFSEVHADIQQKFINTLTHDLQNPIAAAKMNAQLILKQATPDASTVLPTKRIISSLNRLNSMIYNLLDASRVRAGERLALEFLECDLDAVIREVVEEATTVFGDRFNYSSKESNPGNWGCDGIRRAVENLIGNAVKYGTPDSRISVSLFRNEKGVEITVHNLGDPIPEEEIPLLFQQFRRARSAQTGHQSGWGLGLTLVKGVVDAHQGKIRVESAAGKGTSFILEIPFAAPAPSIDDLEAKSKAS